MSADPLLLILRYGSIFPHLYTGYRLPRTVMLVLFFDSPRTIGVDGPRDNFLARTCA